MQACKMEDCLSYFLIYMLSIAFNFTLHFKIAVYNYWKEKKLIYLEIGSGARRRKYCLPHLALLRTWLWEEPGSFQREASVSTELPSRVIQAEPGRAALPGIDI